LTAPLVLASGSATRRAILEAAGLLIIADAPDLDENAIKLSCRTQGLSVGETARVLAVAKATQVAPRHPGRIVLGADQMLECEGVWFDKPADRAAAARQIAKLSGRTHTLFSAIAAIRDDAVIWRAIESAELTIRPLSASFIESYLDRVGDGALSSVGGYQVEGVGIQLFSAIQGEHSTILGLPLLPLLDFLRDEGVVAR
jgi:septum formation protein